METQFKRFFEIFLEALHRIQPHYFETVYKSMDAIDVALGPYRHERRAVSSISRNGERIFCYELYHHLRILIDIEREQNYGFLPGAFLQAEVYKLQVLDLIERFGLEQLSRNFIPDFLVHTPGNADLHAFVVEVKVNRRLSVHSLSEDLNKLQEFITRYKYKRGIFLSVLTEWDYLTDLIGRAMDEHLIWDPLVAATSIFIINKESVTAPATFRTLKEFI